MENMNPENDGYSGFDESEIIPPGIATAEAVAVIEMPDITPVLFKKEIMDEKLEEYDKSLKQLVTKYARSKKQVARHHD
jgi:hypothetical protein